MEIGENNLIVEKGERSEQDEGSARKPRSEYDTVRGLELVHFEPF